MNPHSTDFDDETIPLRPSSPRKAPLPLHIAHILFMDIVGYSRLSMNSQAAVQRDLQKIVQASAEVREAQTRDGGLIIRPTGDGMALLFFHDLLSPLRCAVEISNTLKTKADRIKERTGTVIRLRMGIHSGPVLLTRDLNQQTDVAGDGIVIAQRVMDCGDAGHILLSAEVARAIENLQPWPRWLEDLGTCSVKHGVLVHLYNLCGKTVGCSANFGNMVKPQKVYADGAVRREAARRQEAWRKEREAEERLLPYRRSLTLLGSTLAVLIVAGGIWRLASPDSFASTLTNTKTTFASLHFPLPHTGRKPDAIRANIPLSPPASISRLPADGNPAPPGSMPNLVGLSLKQATAVARKRRLNLQIVSDTSDYASDLPTGQIYRQNPAPGTSYQPRDPVSVYSSKKRPPEEESTNIPAAGIGVWHPSAGEETAVPHGQHTGILIDAHHLSPFQPDANTSILSADGRKLYPDAETEYSTSGGGDFQAVHYYTPETASPHAVYGKHPLILRAEAVVSPYGVANSVRLGPEATQQWRAEVETLNLPQTHPIGILMPGGGK